MEPGPGADGQIIRLMREMGRSVDEGEKRMENEKREKRENKKNGEKEQEKRGGGNGGKGNRVE
jgi:hypothetical protein